MKIDTVFLDMDGVLTDFVGAAAKVHGKECPYSNKPFSKDLLMHEEWGMDLGEFWTKICEDEAFWHNLSKTPECDALMDILVSLKDVDLFIASSPCMDPKSHHGKATWIQEHYPKLLNKMILTNHKHLLAKPNTLLIDDTETNVARFMKNGGRTILFPRPWNSKYIIGRNAGDVMKYVTMELRRFVR